MTEHQPTPASTRWFVVVLALLSTLAVGFLLGVMYGQRDSEPMQAMMERIAEAAAPNPTRTLVPTRTPIPTETPVPTPTVDFGLTTAALWSRHKSATELQWPAYVDSIAGTRVGWQGKVIEVSPGGVVKLDPEEVRFPVTDLLAHELSQRMGKGGLFAITFDLPREEALVLSKDQLVAFEGRIKSVRESGATVVSVTLENVRIVNQDPLGGAPDPGGGPAPLSSAVLLHPQLQDALLTEVDHVWDRCLAPL